MYVCPLTPLCIVDGYMSTPQVISLFIPVQTYPQDTSRVDISGCHSIVLLSSNRTLCGQSPTHSHGAFTTGTTPTKSLGVLLDMARNIYYSHYGTSQWVSHTLPGVFRRTRLPSQQVMAELYSRTSYLYT